MRRVIVLGDSHARIFDECKDVVHVERVPGATANGMLNDDSVTGARKIYREIIAGYPYQTWTVFNLGEVDCNAAAFRQEDLSETDWIHKATKNYQEYLKWASGVVKPIVCSVHLPPVEDYSGPEYTDQERAPRALITAKKAIRTALVMFFNTLMDAFCEDNEIPFIDYTQEITGPDGLLNMDFAIDPGNSHLDKRKIGRIVCPKLKEIIEERRN